PPKPDAKAAQGAHRVVLLVDRSMSMGHAAVWPVALDSARAVVNALAPGDRVAVIAFDEDAIVEQSLTADHALALAAVNRIKVGARATRYGAAIRAAREVLSKESDATGGEVLVVTDLQRNGAAGLGGVSLPAAVQLRAINASPRHHGNSAIASVT